MLSTAIPESDEKSSKLSRFPIGNTLPPSVDPDTAIASLLSRANLLKVRGQWEEAVTVCTDAIRRSPYSATAHALLGDIYLAQGKGTDALHWYRMALDRNPNLSGLLEKHDRLVAEKRASVTGGHSVSTLTSGNRSPVSTNTYSSDKTQPLSPTSVPTLTPKPVSQTGNTTVERTLEWFDRMFPVGNSERMTRSLFTISGIAAALVIAIGSWLYLSLHKSDTNDGQALNVADAHAIVPISALTIPSAPAVPVVTPPSVASVPASEETLLQHLSVLNSDELTVTSAQADTNRSQVQVEIAVVSHSNASILEERNRILQASAKVSQAAFAATPTLQRFSVRVLMRTQGATGSPDAINANLVFVGETTDTALHTLNATSPLPDYTLLSALFTKPWWASSLSVPSP